MSQVIDTTREEVNARVDDVIAHAEESVKRHRALSEKIVDSFFKVAKEIHGDIKDRQKKSSNE